MLELLTSQDMATADRLTIAAGVPGLQLMESAGDAVAQGVAGLAPAGSSVVVVAGPGNNGGDGFVAARLLAERGYAVRLMLLGPRQRLTGDAAVMADRWRGEIEPGGPSLPEADVIVDALFGAGLDRPLQGAAAAIVEAINRAGAKVLAVDLPSGINGTTGEVMGVAVRAHRTVTFFRRKPGHLLYPGRAHCGVTTLAQIGIDPGVLERIGGRTFANAPPLWRAAFPVPGPGAHKYTRGHAVVVSGPLPTTGAARLAARAALRAGAGLVTLATPREALIVNAAASLAVMVREADDARHLGTLLVDRRFNAVLLGPGGGVGQALRDRVAAALDGERAVVLDADALTSYADDPAALFARLRERRSPAVLTPHEGEFERLFGRRAGSKCDRARAAAAESHAVIVLKGADTVVAAPDGRACIAENAPPWLATAGSGDVLAGIITGLLAQGMPAWDAASAAVWVHGDAGSRIGPGLISEDISEYIPKTYKDLLS